MIDEVGSREIRESRKFCVARPQEDSRHAVNKIEIGVNIGIKV